MKKNDCLLIVAVIILSALIFFIFYIFRGGESYAVVEVGGEVVARFPLDNDTEYLIESENGSNLLIIKDGKAYISEASCPDKVCVNTGAASSLRPIVCKPNTVIIYIEGSDE